MENNSSRIENKIKILKEVIISRSELRYHRNDLTWEKDIYMPTDDTFEELILYVKVEGVECPDCSFEPETINYQLTKYIKSIYNSIKSLTFDNKLNMVANDGQSLRGVLIQNMTYSFDELTFEFGIYIDPISS